VRLRLAGLLLALFAGTASAAELRSVEVDYIDGRYMLDSIVWFDADVENLYAILTRWDISPRYTSGIAEAEDLPPDSQGRPRFYIRNQGCVLFFCMSMERRGYVESVPNEFIGAYGDPDFGDFDYSEETWQFEEAEGGTIIHYSFQMEPSFWVPPAIGPWMIKRTLKRGGANAVNRIEAIAQAWPNIDDVVLDD
jgi:hypothetical protein